MGEQAAAPAGGMASIAARGSALNSAQWFANKLATAGAMFLVARLVSPAEFGLASQSLAIYQFAVFLAPLTLGDVLIARPRRLRALAPSARALAWKLGLSMSATLLLVAPIAVFAYPDYPAAWLAGLLSVLALRPLLEAALVVPLSELRVALSFRRIAMVDGLVQFAATCVTLVSAALGAGAAALVLPQIAGVAARARIYGAETRHGSRAPGSVSRQRLLFSAFLPASLAQYSHNVLVMLEVLVLGFVAGGSQTGLFGFAYTLAAQANTVIAFQLGQVLQPIFGHLQDDRQRQVIGFIRVQRALAAICVPVAVAQAVVAEPLFRLLFPTDWQGAASSFQVLSLAQAVYFCSGPTMSCLRAQHRFSYLLWWQTIQLLLSLPVYWLGASTGGAVGIAIASGCVWALSVVVGMRAVVHGIEARPLQTVVAVLAQPWIVCLPALAAGLFLTANLSRFGMAGDIIAVAVAVPVLMVLMFACMRLLNRDVDHAFRKVKGAAIRRFRA
jgi:O-antigen/teichoic acid export membrane protein